MSRSNITGRKRKSSGDTNDTNRTNDTNHKDDTDEKEQLVQIVLAAFSKSVDFQSGFGLKNVNDCYDLVYSDLITWMEPFWFLYFCIQSCNNPSIRIYFDTPRIIDRLFDIARRFKLEDSINIFPKYEKYLFTLAIGFCSPFALALLKLPSQDGFNANIQCKNALYILLGINAESSICDIMVSRLSDSVLNHHDGAASILHYCIKKCKTYATFKHTQDMLGTECEKVYHLLSYCYDDGSGIDLSIKDQDGFTAYEVLRNYTATFKVNVNINNKDLSQLQRVARAIHKKQQDIDAYKQKFMLILTETLKVVVFQKDLLFIISLYVFRS